MSPAFSAVAAKLAKGPVAVLPAAVLPAVVPPAAVPVAQYHDPAWLVRRAWSSHRLTDLQAIVRTTIGELQELPAADVMSDCAPGDWRAERTARIPDPLLEALRACSEELRDASGMAGSHVARAAHCTLVRRYISQQPPAWAETFSTALDGYRHAASALLLQAFEQKAAAP